MRNRVKKKLCFAFSIEMRKGTAFQKGVNDRAEWSIAPFSFGSQEGGRNVGFFW